MSLLALKTGEVCFLKAIRSLRVSWLQLKCGNISRNVPFQLFGGCIRSLHLPHWYSPGGGLIVPYMG